MGRHVDCTTETDSPVYCCDPHPGNADRTRTPVPIATRSNASSTGDPGDPRMAQAL